MTEQFKGFPAKTKFTAIPNSFFSTLLPQISDINELKTTLHIFQTLYQKRGYPRFTTYKELLASKSLMDSLAGTSPPDKVLHNALEMASRRGTILHLALDRDGAPEDVYFLNTESDRQALAKIQNGELALSGLKAKGPAYTHTEKPPDVFTLYEQNIGMLTPLIAEELKEAIKLYPESWIRDAIKEAVSLNKRSWRYIAKILEHWSAEGKGDGTHRGDFKKADPDKYIKGKYGHMVRR
jgi:DnaD/phage-associated family protein